MNLKTYTFNNRKALQLSGRFDAHAASDVSAWLDKETAVSHPRLLINLDGVNFIDSAGLAVLSVGLKRCHKQGGQLELCHLQEPVRIIFELSCLDKVFTILNVVD